MECLTSTISFDIFINKYFTSFRLLTLGVKNIRAPGVLDKNRLRNNALSLGTKRCKKRNVATFNSGAHIKQKSIVTCMVGQNDTMAIYLNLANLTEICAALEQSWKKTYSRPTTKYPIYSKYPIRCLLWWHKILLRAIWAQMYSEPLQASKMEWFCVNS